jgi:hypothetical protein
MDDATKVGFQRIGATRIGIIGLVAYALALGRYVEDLYHNKN